MKKSLIILTTICVFFFTSCEQDNTTQLNGNDAVNLQSNSSFNFGGGSACDYEEDEFERHLHWFSFMAAAALVESEEAQLEVSNATGTGSTKTISAPGFLGSSEAMPNFRQEFMLQLEFYAQNVFPEPDPETKKPVPPIVPGIVSNTTSEEIVQDFLNIILNENCVELYFPEGVNFTPSQFNISTTAHPLTGANCNEGIIRYTNLQNAEDSDTENDPSIGYITNEIIVNQNHLNTYDNIIIARPVRDPLSTICNYNEYNVEDFKLFMN